MLSFANKKQLRFVITLGTGKFGSSDNNRITLQGYRSSVNIDNAGGVQMSELRAQIYGVSQQDINSITTLRWRPEFIIDNKIEVTAIDGTAETLVFQGNIVNAWGDYQNMPDVFLMIQARAVLLPQLKAVPPRSIRGPVDVASVMAQIARSMELKFENNGVDVQLGDIYLANTDLEQAKELAEMAGIWMYPDLGVLAIAPRNEPRGSTIAVVSALSGMVGYPTFDATGVNFSMLFNPAVQWGARIKVVTDIKQAAGEWIVTSMGYRLESEKPNGVWMMTVYANGQNFAIRRQ